MEIEIYRANLRPYSGIEGGLRLSPQNSGVQAGSISLWIICLVTYNGEWKQAVSLVNHSRY